MSMIYLQLEQISGDSNAVQVNCKSIAIWSLLVIWPKTFNESQQFDTQLHPSQQQLLELWDQIHTTYPILATVYLNILLGCIKVDCGQVLEGAGADQLARVASLGLLRAISSIDSTAQNLSQHYLGVIPYDANLEHLLCYHTIATIHILFVGKQRGFSFQWIDYQPCPQEYTLFANTLVQAAYKARENQRKVPCWILRFVLHSLSLNPLPSTSIAVSSLSIIAIDLGCDLSSTMSTNLEERCVHTEFFFLSLTQNQCAN